MLQALVQFSIRRRMPVAIACLLLLIAGGYSAATLPIDALPDVSTVQVTILTESPGLSPVDVEQKVTTPIERALNGVPRLSELRSVSRASLSAVTVVFRDGTDVWFARQLVLERLREVEGELPDFVGVPQLAPVSTGLGEIYVFVIASEGFTPMQLRTLLDWDVIPRIRQVPGVIEVNSMGGELKQYQVIASPTKLHALGLSLEEVESALRKASGSAGAGYVEHGSEMLLVRGVGLLRDEEDIRNVVIRSGQADAAPITVRQIAEVRVAPALRYGANTRDGKGEVVTGTVMMLLGANSREVVRDVGETVEQLQKELPQGVRLEPIYDRSDFVGRTLTTVTRNLLEGALVVLAVLTLFLGSVRGAAIVVLGIPVSMSMALFVMHLTGVPGDLMSLGAIDFGFLVDGPVVMLEALLAGLAGRAVGASREAADRQLAATLSSVARPVAFAVAIIMLVYLPLFALQGIEGKMFRPMALVMASALFGGLVYSILFLPALLSLFLPRSIGHGPKWLDRLTRSYAKLLPWALRHRGPLLAGTLALLVLAGWGMAGQGADFVPRIDEGDVVVTIRRAPSIALTQAKQLDLEAEQVLAELPEVVTSVAFTGRAELAFDPVGNDNTDLLVHLRPKEEWKTAHDLDGLSMVIKERIEERVPGTFVSVSQPIEDRTNEMISGSRADVAIQIYGDEIEKLAELAEQVGSTVRPIRGTGDVRIERLLGMPNLQVTPDRARLARFGARVEDLFRTLESARMGMRVGQVFDAQRRFDVRLLAPPKEATTAGFGDLFVETAGGVTVPMRELARVEEVEGPAAVRREGLRRTVRVEVNLRGRDLVSWVAEAQGTVKQAIPLGSGYTMTWGGQFENFARAKERLGLVVPLALSIIFVMLLAMFGDVRAAFAVFTLVPMALIGGMAGLIVRDLSFSLPAAVGFIALAGVAVLNGVVMASNTLARITDPASIPGAVRTGAEHTSRAVLTTAVVAALGFLPMALSSGAGSEVQRPLATVVIFGIFGSTALMLLVFPGILSWTLRAPAEKPSNEPVSTIGQGDDGSAMKHAHIR